MPQLQRPNILLITSDQQRFDTLGCNGNSYVRTPHIDALAGRGVNFQRAFVQNTVCIPSRACIQTGRYIHQHGVEYMEDTIDDTPGLPPWETTFMERLQVAGYRTAAYGKLHMMPHKGFHEMQVCGGKGERWTQSAGLPIGLAPLGRDYAAWLEARHPGAYELIYQQRRHEDYGKHYTAISNVLPLEEYVDYWIAENTISFLRQQHERPFFAWCGFCGPHGPMDPPKPYDTMYPYDSIPLPPNYLIDLEGKPRTTTPEQDAAARRFISHYYAQVTLIDDMVGRILAALRETGRLDNTLILYTSDHGEMLWERNRRHKIFFYDPVTRVPLIVVPPGGAARLGAFDGLVEVFDVAPTVLEYAGAAVPAAMAATSLRSTAEGNSAGKEMALCEFVAFDRTFKGICLRTRRFKYIQWNDNRGNEFYDLERDPLERQNLIDDPPSRDEIRRHQEMLINRLIETGAKM